MATSSAEMGGHHDGPGSHNMGGGGAGGAANDEAHGAEAASGNSCIGELEHHIHKIFSSTRIPGEDFVYHPIPELFAKLENYCNHSQAGMDSGGHGISSSRAPLLVIGESGIGKSALLSNWLERRFRNGQRLRTTEFVFWHAVGCSRQSTNVNNLIRRLIVDLKQRFEIGRDVPTRQERLSWELPRFLDLASRKGKIIVVIDGVHRLMSDDNTEASLAWLPLELPPNVKFVMSATISKSLGMFEDPSTAANNSSTSGVNSANTNNIVNTNLNTINEKHVEGFYIRSVSPAPAGGTPTKSRSPVPPGAHDRPTTASNPQPATTASTASMAVPSVTLAVGAAAPSSSNAAGGSALQSGRKGSNWKGRILSEIERRPWTILRVRALEQNQCRALIMSYVQKSVQSEASASTANISSFFMTSGPLSPSSVLSESVGSKPLSSGSGDQGDGQSPTHADQLSGFLLFECHVKSLQQHPQAGIPLFVRLFLRCAHLCCCRGFSLWHIWDHWLTADSVSSLLELIMQTLEKGHTKDEKQTQEAIGMLFFVISLHFTNVSCAYSQIVSIVKEVFLPCRSFIHGTLRWPQRSMRILSQQLTSQYWPPMIGRQTAPDLTVTDSIHMERTVCTAMAIIQVVEVPVALAAVQTMRKARPYWSLSQINNGSVLPTLPTPSLKPQR
jgi:GTPase SAR1 family protein